MRKMLIFEVLGDQQAAEGFKIPPNVIKTTLDTQILFI